jgi:hypothetical protein
LLKANKPNKKQLFIYEKKFKPFLTFTYMEQEVNQFNSQASYSGVGIRDLEEKQRIMKDRILLIGKNLIEIREKNNKDILGIKKELEIIKKDVKRMTDFLKTASAEFSRFARKDELEILVKQAKMFQPLELVTKKDVQKIVQEEIKK